MAFYRAHVEMFYLTQCICSIINPGLQKALDDTRREIMEQVTLNIKAPTGARMVANNLSSSRIIWSGFQITPEISADPDITGNAVLLPLLKRLRRLLRDQISTVSTAVFAR